MNTERTIVLENASTQSIGLKDTQGRTYRLGVGAKVRISQVSLQDILDYPASRIIFDEGLAKISNIDLDSLYKMGLSEDEITKYSLDDYSKEMAEEVVEEEPVTEEEPVKETKTTKPAAKKTTTSTKKATTKKSTSSKSSK